LDDSLEKLKYLPIQFTVRRPAAVAGGHPQGCATDPLSRSPEPPVPPPRTSIFA
jgi:hypothetical protein